MEAKDVHNPIFPEPIQDDLNMEIIADVLAKIRLLTQVWNKKTQRKKKRKRNHLRKEEKLKPFLILVRIPKKLLLVRGPQWVL